MPNVEYKGKRKTKPVGFSLSPYLVEKLEEYTGAEKYGNKSSIVSQALSEFFAREEMRKENKLYNSMVVRENESEYGVSKKLSTDIIAEFFKSQEGKDLLRSIIQESLSSSSLQENNKLLKNKASSEKKYSAEERSDFAQSVVNTLKDDLEPTDIKKHISTGR